MSKKWNETDDFKTLKNEWYDKLKDSGFDDIEYNTKTGSLVKRPGYEISKKLGTQLGVGEYYRRATIHASHIKFANKWDKYIWLNHCEGVSVRSISKNYNEGLPRNDSKKISANKVHLTIVRMREAMVKCKCWETSGLDYTEEQQDLMMAILNKAAT